MSAQPTNSHDMAIAAKRTVPSRKMRYFVLSLVATLSLSLSAITMNSLLSFESGVENFLQDLLLPQNSQSSCRLRCASSGNPPCGCSHSLLTAIMRWPNRSCGWPPSYACHNCQNASGQTSGHVQYDSAR